MEYLFERYKEIEVAWTPELDGGGRGFGQQYIPVVQYTVGKVDRVFEWCAGPGFIGLSLLANNLCNSLCVADINPKAVAALRETVRRNNLEDRVSVYLSDNLNDIPEVEQWDLVVANPPHFNSCTTDDFALRTTDLEWNLHREFFSRVGQHMRPHASLMIQENYMGSREGDFTQYLAPNGLGLVGSFMTPLNAPPYEVDDQLIPLNTFYYLWIRKNHRNIVWSDIGVEDVTVELGAQPRSGERRRLPGNRKYRIELGNAATRPIRLVLEMNGRAMSWPYPNFELDTSFVLPPAMFAAHTSLTLRDVDSAKELVTLEFV